MRASSAPARVTACVVTAAFAGAWLSGCGDAGQSAATSGPKTTSQTEAVAPASGQPLPGGGPAPSSLQGTWRLASRNSPEAGLLLILSDSHYRVAGRFASGDLVVDGNEIAFFNAALCGLTLPEGVGRYRWTVEGNRLRLDSIKKDPCGGRTDILDGMSYERVG